MEEKPKLRAIKAIPMNSGGERIVYLRDPSGATKAVVALTPRVFFLASLLDGEHTLSDIQAEYERQFGEALLSTTLESLVRRLDDALMLEGERFEVHRRRKAKCSDAPDPPHHDAQNNSM